MLDKAIADFLENKKQGFLEKKITAKTSEENKLKLSEEANEKYLFENWLFSMIETANAFFTTHPSKLTHSTPLSKQSKDKAKDLNTVFTKGYAPDGFLKTGNVCVDMDLSGYPDNGASTELFSFLKIELEDKRTVFEHFESNSEYIQEQVNLTAAGYSVLRNSFLPASKVANATSERVKQVYFPVGDDYHLLSVLTASGIIFKLKQKINETRFSEENKFIREELKQTLPRPLSGKIEEIYDLTSIGYGGTNAQNVSVLNNQNGGVSFLLSSLPPSIEKRQTQPPKKDFFNDCLWAGLFKKDFDQFHKVLSWRKNNKDVRDIRDDIVLNSITKLKRLVDNIREVNAGWSDSETYSDLAIWQKIWLDNKHTEIRSDDRQNQRYLGKAQSYFANWFIGNYKHSTKDNKLLGDDDIEQIKKVLEVEQELLK